MSSKTDTAKSVEMHQVVGAILKDITKAREISDRYSNYVGEGYRPKLTDEGSIENENQLISYSVPRAEISDVNVNLKFAIDKVEEAQDADEANQFFFNTIIEKYTSIFTDEYFSLCNENKIKISPQKEQSYKKQIRDSIAQWIQDTFICEISEEQKNLQIQINEEKESIKKTIIEDFTNHLKKIPIPLVNIFDILNKKKQFTVEEIVNLYKKNAGVFKEHLEIERPELLAANNTDSGEVNLKFKDPKIKESIILKKDKSKWEEGISWREQISNTTNQLLGIAFGNGLWVAVGVKGTILTSSDGISWTKLTNPTTHNLTEIAYANGIWVIVGYSGSILTSKDGISWTRQTSHTGEYLSSVAYGNGLWVVFSLNNRVILTSSDGISWTKRQHSTKRQFLSVSYGNGIWVAVGNNGAMLTSNNGVSWTERESGASLSSVVYGNGIWVAVGGGVKGTILTSSDGISWTKRTSNARSRLRDVFYGNGLWVAVGAEVESTTLTSSDGISWNKQSTESRQAVSYANGMWITVDHNGAIFTSAGNGDIKSFVNELYELEKPIIAEQEESNEKIQTSLKNDEVIKESIEKIPTEKMSFKKDDQLMIQVELEELKKRERVSEINFKTNIKNHKWLRGEKGMFNLIPEE